MRFTLLVVCIAAPLFGQTSGFLDDLSAEPDSDPSGWVGSKTCLTCHRDRHRTWRRTFHRTMTQDATPDTVAAPFDASILDYWGHLVRPVRDGDRFYFEYLNRQSGIAYKRLPVLRTVGSNRYQQYFTQDDEAGPGNFWRLPLLWHIREQRWIHLNAVFLGTDEQGFDSHLTMWNQNCIFCHNTGPSPGIQNMDALTERIARGESVDFRYDPRYQSSVAELGIACESCHGPGQAHAQSNRNPLRRYYLHVTESADPTIVNPARLSAQRATDICGQCHAQRVPRRRELIRDWLETGPTYRPGDALNDHVEPIRMETAPPDPSSPDQFRLRFWQDGTPRLSAYEYQGLTMSACFDSEELSCDTCHEAHAGSPQGMIEESVRKGDETCAGCHQAIAAAATEHSGHSEPDNPLCYDCHMPKMVYGVMTIHRSHRIEIPNPAQAQIDQRPDACTNCHVDRSQNWAASVVARTQPPAEPAMPRVVADMLGGDPVQRAVAAYWLAQVEPQRGAYATPFLLMALSDRYPMLRWLARKALIHLQPEWAGTLTEWDFIAAANDRETVVQQLWDRWRNAHTRPLPPSGTPLDEHGMPLTHVIAPLLAGRAQKEIDIGE